MRGVIKLFIVLLNFRETVRLLLLAIPSEVYLLHLLLQLVRECGQRGSRSQSMQPWSVHHLDMPGHVVTAGSTVGAVRAVVGFFQSVRGGQVTCQHILPVGTLEPLPAQRTHDGPVPLQHTMLSAPDLHSHHHHHHITTTTTTTPSCCPDQTLTLQEINAESEACQQKSNETTQVMHQ